MSKQRAKGTSYEVRVLEMLREVWPDVERAHFASDIGDFVGTGPYVIEAKNHKSINLAGFMDQAVREASNLEAATQASVPLRHYEEKVPVVIQNRKNCRLGRSYVVMELDDWLDMAALAQGITPEDADDSLATSTA